MDFDIDHGKKKREEKEEGRKIVKFYNYHKKTPLSLPFFTGNLKYPYILFWRKGML